MTKIIKTVIVTTVYHAAANDADRTSVAHMSLADIDALIDTGDGIGMAHTQSVEEIAPDEVRAELLTVGNDGSFFDDVLNDEAPEGWTVAEGSAGYNVGDADVYGRFIHGRALYVFQAPGSAYWTGVVTNSHSISGATLQEACARTETAAAAEPGRGQRRAAFTERMTDPRRLTYGA